MRSRPDGNSRPCHRTGMPSASADRWVTVNAMSVIAMPRSSECNVRLSGGQRPIWGVVEVDRAQLRARRDPELGQEAGQLGADGLGAQQQQCGDLSVAEALRGQ